MEVLGTRSMVLLKEEGLIVVEDTVAVKGLEALAVSGRQWY